MADRRVSSGLSDEEIEDIIRDNYREVFKYCFLKTKDYSCAEDITQDTFLRFIEYLPKYSDKGKPKALLYTIARNLCINWHEKKKPDQLLDDVIDRIRSLNEDEDIVTRLSLERYLEELPKEHQEILMLRYYQELSINELTQVFEVNRFAIMYRLKVAKKMLKTIMEQGGWHYE